MAYGRGSGRLDWSLFAGLTLFRVEADLLGQPGFTDVYPYDELAISSIPSTTVDDSPSGFNVGGRVDYRWFLSEVAGFQVPATGTGSGEVASPGGST